MVLVVHWFSWTTGSGSLGTDGSSRSLVQHDHDHDHMIQVVHRCRWYWHGGAMVITDAGSSGVDSTDRLDQVVQVQMVLVV
jgi:hypothetical protein